MLPTMIADCMVYENAEDTVSVVDNSHGWESAAVTVYYINYNTEVGGCLNASRSW